MADNLATTEEVNFTTLLTAAIFYDYGKIFDYDDEGARTPHHSLIRHVVRSYAEFMRLAGEVPGADPTIVAAISHCILAHHGRKEWGSPVEPLTVEAHILHYADMLSSKFGVGR